MRDIFVRKGLVTVIIVLFVGASIAPIAGLTSEKHFSTDDKVNSEVNNRYSLIEQSGRSEDWWDNDWSYSKKITINHDMVAGDLQNFPILISDISSDYINHAQPDGDDFVFVSADNTTKYNHEIEYYDSSSGELIAWVNIPSLSSSDDTVLYMYYGNPTCNNQQNVYDTWDSNYKMVQHVEEGGTGIRYDSTLYDHDGTPVGYDGDEETTGIVDGADHLDGIDDYIYFGDVNTAIYTCTVWIKPDITVTKNTVSENLWHHGGSSLCALGDSTSLLTDETICLHAGNLRTGVINVDISNTMFHMITYTWRYDISRYDIYFDGVIQDVVSGGDGHVPLMTSPFAMLGHQFGTGSYFGGIVDEARISSVARSEEWIKTSYNTMSSPSSFLSIGPEIELTSPDFVYVDDDFDSSTPGWGYDHFDKIQDGIDAVNNYGTVYVYNGIYYENVIVDKTINLIGENRNITTIDGGGTGDVVYVSVELVNITGFTIKNSGNYFSDWNPDAGIDSRGNNVLISGNILKENGFYGIYIRNSQYTIISENNVNNNDDDGIYLHYSSNCMVTDNIISDHTGDGISIKEAENTIVWKNSISENYAAFVISDSAINNTIYENDITSNFESFFLNSNDNKLYHNNNINNTQSGYDYGSNIWDNGYPSGGNYWDDYTGNDNFNGPNQDIPGSDGIGDSPYLIPNGDSQDNYPLITPYGPPHADFNYTKNGKTVIFNASLSYDYNGEITSYEWDFGDGYTGTGMIISHTYTNYGTYTVTLEVTDDDGLTDEKPKLITLVNNPPNTPSNPEPSDGATGVSVYAILSWTCSDPDGDELIYDVYFGTSSNPPLVSTGQSWTFYNPPGAMEYSTHYYWKIVAWDPYDASTTGPIWDFTTTSEPNNPPESPSNPSPKDSATDVKIDTILSWNCSDPDGDDLVYDVYFEANDPTPDILVSDDQTENTYNPGTLKMGTTYYWQIIAKDIHGASTPGPIWSFTTKKESTNKPPSSPIINGPTSGKPGDHFSYTFISVDPEDDNIYYQIDWGDGIVDDWFGPFKSNEIQTQTHGWIFTGKFTIKARAKDVNDAMGDWGSLEVNIQKNKVINTQSLKFLQTHTNLFVILQKILQRLELR